MGSHAAIPAFAPSIFEVKRENVNYLDPEIIRAYENEGWGSHTEPIIRGRMQIGIDQYENLLESVRSHQVCALCHQTTIRRGDAQRHLADVHMKWYKPFKCSQCDHRSSQAQQIKTHELSRHAIGAMKACKVLGCTKTFADASRLSVHERSHTEEEIRQAFENGSNASKAARQSTRRRQQAHVVSSSSAPTVSSPITPTSPQKHLFPSPEEQSPMSSPKSGPSSGKRRKLLAKESVPAVDSLLKASKESELTDISSREYAPIGRFGTLDPNNGQTLLQSRPRDSTYGSLCSQASAGMIFRSPEHSFSFGNVHADADDEEMTMMMMQKIKDELEVDAGETQESPVQQVPDTQVDSDLPSAGLFDDVANEETSWWIDLEGDLGHRIA